MFSYVPDIEKIPKITELGSYIRAMKAVFGRSGNGGKRHLPDLEEIIDRSRPAISEYYLLRTPKFIEDMEKAALEMNRRNLIEENQSELASSLI
jgi:hypothetical protein